ncbi:MAG TPA: TIGR02757 family protein, partial [Bacteroidia bacterium]|nr:TIGR02757 family protein [Bacteroidia bacterium]
RKEDIEIAGFLAATVAWGQRPVIIRNANLLMERMDLSPYEFVMNASAKDLKKLDSFVHRTFNGIDARFFVLALRNIYEKHNGMEELFADGIKMSGHKDTKARRSSEITPLQNSIIHFRETFLSLKHNPRSDKHISNPAANSSAKRINMYLRWMVRRDKAGVDFGIWKSIPPALLRVPLDVHVGNVARKLGLLVRKQDDWKAVEELTDSLREFDKNDPVKYDFALFGLGIFEGF